MVRTGRVRISILAEEKWRRRGGERKGVGEVEGDVAGRALAVAVGCLADAVGHRMGCLRGEVTLTVGLSTMHLLCRPDLLHQHIFRSLTAHCG